MPALRSSIGSFKSDPRVRAATAGGPAEVFDKIDSVLGDWGYVRLPGEERMQMVWRGRVAVDWPAEWADTLT